MVANRAAEKTVSAVFLHWAQAFGWDCQPSTSTEDCQPSTSTEGPLLTLTTNSC